MTSGGPPSEETRIIRRQPEAAPPPSPEFSEQHTGIIRRSPTGAFPTAPEPQTSFIPQAAPPPLPRQQPPVTRQSPLAASATATVSIISGWATAVIATSLISGWWGTDELFCIAIGFLTAVSAAATIGGLISLLLRQRIGRLLIVVGSVVALMIFAGLFVAGADLPQLVYGIPILPVAAITLALLPATGRWCR
ncbi:hypothetical protein [Mycobacterium sp. AT1]|uniref:hypothetical protein n=1 Tax=Mycobacterium sp. AT1 TaxID=1961706 RepID=UPI0009AE26DE|nr:hypothetical protein B1790_23990 [Mycobacterium sp. AT1]